MYKLTKIEAIGAKFAELLEQAGIETQEQLLAACRQHRERQALATQTGISLKLIVKWTNHADLARVCGVGDEYAELLERSGVKTVYELGHCHVNSLYESMRLTNEQTKIVAKTPSLSQVESWVEQAKTLPRIID